MIIIMSAGGMLLGLAMAGLNSIVVENNEFQNTSTIRRFSNPLSLASMYNVAVKHVKSVQRRIDVIRLTGSVDSKLVDFALQVYKDPAFAEKVLTFQLFVHFPVSYCVLKVALLHMAVIDHHYAEMAAKEAVQSGDSTHVKMKLLMSAFCRSLIFLNHLVFCFVESPHQQNTTVFLLTLSLFVS